ncbi:unnamed protein product [Phytomonas sp. EM1]|nr:unnamed protein product [Phytomonas sp. EM1]|eukprot:CCW64369.1 unnamed protein product [Phytomonas sp. isolate EM1]
MLMDVMYADIVLRDRCCGRVGDALIAEHEPVLRGLVSSGKLPSGLEKAIETYCIRHFLSCAPELVLTAPSAVEGLLQLAQSLQERRHETPVRLSTTSLTKEKDKGILEPMWRIGKSILEDVKQLRITMCIEYHEHLIDALGEAVLGFIMQAAAECEREDTDNGTQERTDSNTMVEEDGQVPRFSRTLQRFASSIVKRRLALQRLREAELNNTSNELLFPQSEETMTTPKRVEEAKETQTTAPTDGVAHPSGLIARNARSTPRQSRGKRHAAVATETSPSRALEANETPRRRAIPSKERVGNVREGVMGQAVADEDAAAAWIHHRDVVERTYFLCVETNRFEPIVARGLFEP